MSETPSSNVDTTLYNMSLLAKGTSFVKDGFGDGINYVKEKLSNTENVFILLGIFLMFIGLSYYLYENYVKKMLDKNYVENQEFTDRNTSKQIDVYYFYTNWCPHCKKSMPEWTKFKERVGDIKINNHKVKFFEVDCDKDSKVADKYKVEEYPTIKAINKDDVFEYNAKVDSKTLMDFLESITS